MFAKMHQAWYVDDIRCLIFEHLEPRDLGRLARTCKALFDFAGDELWKTLTSMSPFLCLFPKEFRRRPLRLEELHRVNFYSCKVQNIYLESRNIGQVIRLPKRFQPKLKKKDLQSPVREKSWEELWDEIAKLRPASLFMPNIRRVRISNIEEKLLIPLLGVSAANFTQIYIKYIQNRQSDSVVAQFLEALVKTGTPKLEYIFVRDGEDVLPSKLIQQSPLKHLRLDPRIHAGRHQDFQFKQFPLRPEILSKSTLEHLTIGLTREWYSPELNSLQSKYLPALKTLWLNLTTFKPGPCEKPCSKIYRQGWTCENGFSDLMNGLRLNGTIDCGRRPPTLFFEGMDNPELSLLNIKFPLECTGKMFLDVVSAASQNCRVGNLTELALAGGGWFDNCPECGKRPPPMIEPIDLRKGLVLLLPMHKLKVLRLSVAPNFLDVLDLDMYKKIANGLPAVEKLQLGHREFLTASEFEGATYYERTPLHYLAAFCSMLKYLNEVQLGCADGMMLEESPNNGWVSVGVEKLVICHWVGRGVSRDLLHLGLRTYFPTSDLAGKDFDKRLNERLYFFDSRYS